jgi:hypothetical protein
MAFPPDDYYRPAEVPRRRICLKHSHRHPEHGFAASSNGRFVSHAIRDDEATRSDPI